MTLIYYDDLKYFVPRPRRYYSGVPSYPVWIWRDFFLPEQPETLKKPEYIPTENEVPTSAEAQEETAQETGLAEQIAEHILRSENFKKILREVLVETKTD